MAVEKIRVIGRLRALFPKANLTKERLNAIAERLAKKPEDGADDAAIDAVINDFNDNSLLSIEDIAREDDRLRTLEAKIKDSNPEPPTPPTPHTPPTPPTPPTGDDVPSWAKAILDSNKKLETELEAIKSGKVTEGKKQMASQLFDASDVLKGLKPELKQRWLDRINVDSETSIEDQITGLEEEYSELVQLSADSGDYAGAPPAVRRNQEVKFSTDQADSIVGEMGI